jgi:diguanylate cyclase (GGDEF)-like protein
MAQPQDFYIMVVDDEDSIRSILYETLTSEGYNVSTAASGEEALEMINNGELPHIVMTDIRMPGISGVELAAKVKGISDEIEVIIMTSHASLETATQAIKIGVHDYLYKPFEDLQEVKSIVLRVIDKIYLRMENKQLFEQIKVKNEELTAISDEITAIYKFSQELISLLEPEEIVDAFLNYVSELVNGKVCLFLKFYPAKSALVVRNIRGRNLDKTYTEQQINDFRNIGMGLGAASEKDIVSIISRIGKHPSLKTLVTKLFNTTKYMAFPLIIRDTPIGVSIVIDEATLNERDEKILKQYLNQLEISYDKALLHKRVKDLAIKDGLTGLYNHRFFKERLELEIQTAKRIQHPLSLIFFDIDHFKKYNDINGHPMGDMLLRSIADILKKTSRTTDIPCRYGGEEFVIILTHTNLEGAMVKAEKLRKIIEETDFPNQEKQPLGNLTVSIGVSEVPTHTDNMSHLIEVADDALYRVKEGGRNRVIMANPHEGYKPSYIPKLVTTGREQGPNGSQGAAGGQ